MTKEETKPHRSYIAATLGCYCPRCREGKLFKYPLDLKLNRIMKMNEHCPTCGQPTDLEVGFYYGTSYVSYLIALLIAAVYFVLWWMLIGFSFNDKRFIYWVVSNAVLLVILQPWLMRFSRSLWISWFVKYDAEWARTKPADLERLNDEHMSNW